jgi:betaine lipid synthase
MTMLHTLQIHKDGLSIAKYVARTLDGVAQNSHLRSDNYFYFNCLTGRCA